VALLAPLTELDAANELLGSIGQAPVSSLTSGGDAAIALGELRRSVRYVQLYGFAFNTDTDYLLSPDVNGVIKVPQGVLRSDPAAPLVSLVARRHPDGYLAFWDLANHTWTMALPVTFTITWGFTFDDLPEAAKNYITISAARKFQKRIIGSDELDGFNAEDENRAWTLLLRDERSVQDTNMFRKSATLQRTARRDGRRRVTYP
jgi:hypothetical protein